MKYIKRYRSHVTESHEDLTFLRDIGALKSGWTRELEVVVLNSIFDRLGREKVKITCYPWEEIVPLPQYKDNFDFRSRLRGLDDGLVYLSFPSENWIIEYLYILDPEIESLNIYKSDYYSDVYRATIGDGLIEYVLYAAEFEQLGFTQ